MNSDEEDLTEIWPILWVCRVHRCWLLALVMRGLMELGDAETDDLVRLIRSGERRSPSSEDSAGGGDRALAVEQCVQPRSVPTGLVGMPGERGIVDLQDCILVSASFEVASRGLEVWVWSGHRAHQLVNLSFDPITRAK